MRNSDKLDRNHPYAKRTWWRGRLPWLLINLGIASKGKNCEIVNAEHHWYNKDGKFSACYHCEIVREGKHWHLESDEILAFEHFGAELGKDYYLSELKTDQEIEMLFDLCQIQRANIRDIGWKYLFEKVGIDRIYQIDKKSGWFDTENEKEWIESIYYQALICGYNPINGKLGAWNEESNIFNSEDSKCEIDWNKIHLLTLLTQN